MPDDVGVLLERLADQPVGPPLLGLLQRVDPARLSRDDQFSWLQAAERLAAAGAGLVSQGIAAITVSGRSDAFADAAREDVMVATRVSATTAHARMELAEDLYTRLPATAAAWRAGDISVGHARVLSEKLIGLDAATAAALEAKLLPLAANSTPGLLGRAAARAAARANPAALAEQQAQRTAERRAWINLPAGTLFAQLPPDGIAAVAGTLHSLAHPDGPDDPRPLPVRLADALVECARRVGAGATDPAGGYRTGVQVVVAATSLLGLTDAPAEIPGTGPIPADTARRLACDGLFHRLLSEPQTGRLLDLGRAHRDPDDRLRRHILTRDRHCQFPGCTRPAHRCEVHHTDPWARGGPTDRDNLLSLCPRHHHAVHEGRWRATRNPDHTITWRAPTGHQTTTFATDLLVGDHLPGATPAPERPATTRAGPVSTRAG